jgi:N-acyl-D-amino-acid deacylase
MISRRGTTIAPRILLAVVLLTIACGPACGHSSVPAPAIPAKAHDLVITAGTLFDGTGAAGRVVDVGIDGDTITEIAAKGTLATPALAAKKRVIDANGLAVAPGFINMLSQAVDTFFADGRGLSDLAQGVTLEIIGEGESPGPLTPEMKKESIELQGDVKYPITWSTLGEYFDVVLAKGISINLGSFVGAATVRTYVLGHDKRAPNAVELARMQGLVRSAMEDGAFGVSSALIYEPGLYATTDELALLAEATKPFDGMYISHMRSEGDRLLEGIDELITIAKRGGVRAEIYHLKAAGQDNWPKLGEALAKVERARAEGLEIIADVYPYTAAASGLDVAMPPWVREGGYDAWASRLKDRSVRSRVIAEMKKKGEGWENFWYASGSPDRVQTLAFKNPALKPLTGKTLTEIAKLRGASSPEEAAIDLVIENGSRVEVAYFLMDEANVAREVALPWTSFCSDAEAMAPIQPFLLSSPHPRAYGTFARVLGKYVRQEKVVSLPQAIRKLTSLPAKMLRVDRRGEVKVGNYADIVVFDPNTIIDHATFERPHQLATGVAHVIVNGELALFNGEPTAARAGRIVGGQHSKRERARETEKETRP